jgi:GNAT superfamily N-acetyltransferase
MIVRKIEAKDLSDILSLIRAKAEFDGCLDSFKSGEEDIRDAFFSSEPKAKAIVAEMGSKVIGIATYYSIYSTFIGKPGIWLDDLYVYEAYRKSGAGKQLMKTLCNIALETGFGRIDWIVARDNENGRAFYESIRAHIFEEVKHSRLDERAIINLVDSAEQSQPNRVPCALALKQVARLAGSIMGKNMQLRSFRKEDAEVVAKNFISKRPSRRVTQCGAGLSLESNRM